MSVEFCSFRWLLVCSIFIRMFFFGGVLKSNSVTLNYTVTRLNSSNASVAWAYTLQCSVAYLLTPLGGKVLLKYFTFRQLGVMGGLLAGLGYVGVGLYMTSIWHLYMWHSISGIGFAVSTIPNIIYLHIHFNDHFGRIIAMGTGCIYVGVAILPITQTWLIDQLGYDGGTMCFGALIWNCVIVGLLMPSTKGTKLYTEQIRSSPSSRDELHVYDEYLYFLSPLLRHSKFTVMTIFGVIGMYVYSSWAIFLVPFGQAQGLATHEAVLLSTFGGVGGVIGSWSSVAMFHLEKMNAITCCFLPMLTNGFVLLLSVYISRLEVLILLMFVSGLVQGYHYGGVSGIISQLVCEYHVESAYAYTCFSEGVFYQLGGLLSGMVLDYTGEAQTIFLVCSTVSFLVTPLTFLWYCDKSPVRDCYPQGRS